MRLNPHARGPKWHKPLQPTMITKMVEHAGPGVKLT